MPKTVLLVDDNRTHQYSLSKHLEESGFNVMCAHTGAETFTMIASHAPDAILLDINLPDMTGFEICERLKQDSTTKRIPVIFHSATHDTQSAKSHAMDLGAISFLSYPISVEHLISVLEGALLRNGHQKSAK